MYKFISYLHAWNILTRSVNFTSTSSTKYTCNTRLQKADRCFCMKRLDFTSVQGPALHCRGPAVPHVTTSNSTGTNTFSILECSRNFTNLKLLFFANTSLSVSTVHHPWNNLLFINTSACGFSFIMPHLSFWADCHTLLDVFLNAWEGRCDAFLELIWQKTKRQIDGWQYHDQFGQLTDLISQTFFKTGRIKIQSL